MSIFGGADNRLLIVLVYGNLMRLTTLDGLRGVAAIMILFYHLGPLAPVEVPAGHLSVDLFFGLSGLVISRAYHDRLSEGLSVWQFTRARVIRIFPMAFLAALFGVALSRRYLPSLLLIPDVSGGATGMLFPMNVPMWSLLLELVVNVLYACCAARLRPMAFCLIILVSGSVLTIGMMRYPLPQIGTYWITVGYGLARTVFSFCIGVAMQRVHAHYPIGRRVTQFAWLLPLALVILLTRPIGPSVPWNLGFLCLALPLILWLGIIWEMPRPRIWEELGGLSYPLYCIHGVAILAYQAMGWPAGLLWAPLILASVWLNHRIDTPIRRGLTQLFTLDAEPHLKPARP